MSSPPSPPPSVWSLLYQIKIDQLHKYYLTLQKVKLYFGGSQHIQIEKRAWQTKVGIDKTMGTLKTSIHHLLWP